MGVKHKGSTHRKSRTAKRRPKAEDPRIRRVAIALTESEFAALSEAAAEQHRPIAQLAYLYVTKALDDAR